MLALTVGEKIRKYRIEKGMTQEELGKHLGVGKAAVQKYESNQVQNLKSAHIKKLCFLFNKIPLDFIFDGVSFEDTKPMEKVKLLRKLFGDDSRIVLLPLAELNEAGLQKVQDYISDIVKIEEYRKHKNHIKEK